MVAQTDHYNIQFLFTDSTSLFSFDNKRMQNHTTTKLLARQGVNYYTFFFIDVFVFLVDLLEPFKAGDAVFCKRSSSFSDFAIVGEVYGRILT